MPGEGLFLENGNFHILEIVLCYDLVQSGMYGLQTKQLFSLKKTSAVIGARARLPCCQGLQTVLIP